MDLHEWQTEEAVVTKPRQTEKTGACLRNRDGKPHVKQENRRARRQRRARERAALQPDSAFTEDELANISRACRTADWVGP